jgi:phage terminase large subunit GpA-like protein
MLESYLSETEIRVARPPANVSFWDWIGEYFQLDSQSSAVAGKYPRDLVPYFKVVADWLDNRKIKKVVWRKAAQEGATTFSLGFLLFRQYRLAGPQMLCLADADTAERMNETRIQPALKAAQCFDDVSFNMRQSEIKLSTGGSILMAWASSVARVASSSIRDMVLDEVTKPAYNLKTEEGDSIFRILQRAVTFPNRKALIMSTVTLEGDKLHQLEVKISPKHLIHLPCPHCGVYQPLFFFPTPYVDIDGNEKLSGCVVWDNDQLTNDSKAMTAHYKCGECNNVWTTEEKNAALKFFKAVPDGPENPESDTKFLATWRILSPRDVGSLQSIVKEFLDAKDDPITLQGFYNNCLGLYWSDRVTKPTNKTFETYRQDYAAGTIPDAAVCLIASVDVQKRGFWYVIRAWSNDETSWKVEHGFCHTEAELNDLLFQKTWSREDGKYMAIWRVGIDTGGEKKELQDSETEMSSTMWVYRWYLKNRARGVQILPTKGASRPLPNIIRIKGVKPRTKKTDRYEIPLVFIDTNKAKDLFFWRVLQSREEEPISPAYTSKEEQKDYFKQLKAEEKRRDRKTGTTKWVRTGTDNHYLDCEQMQQALASREAFGGVTIIKKPILSNQVKTAATKKKKAKKPQPGNLSNPFGSSEIFWGGSHE